jgi:hypothetical protein
LSEPYEIHTRVRQEKGQDIAGACGQLALVNPGSAGAPRDIEDSVSRKYTVKRYESKMKSKHGAGTTASCGTDGKGCGTTGKKEGDCECGTGGCASCDDGPAAPPQKETTWSRNKVLCYANVLIPVLLAAAELVKSL